MIHNRNKTMEITVDVNARHRGALENETTFFSLDAGTAEKIINFTRDHMAFNLTGATVVVGFHFVNGRATKIIDSVDGSVEILDAQAGRASVKIPSHVYDYKGDVMVHVYLTFEDGTSIDCAVIPTRFEGSWLDEQMPELERTSIERFNLLMAMADEIRERLEGSDMVTYSKFREHTEDKNNPHQVTPDQIGAAPTDHKHSWDEIIGESNKALAGHQHDATDITSGVLNINRLPRGTGANQVAVGNHTHTPAQIGAAPANHNHPGMATIAYVDNQAGLIEENWRRVNVQTGTNTTNDTRLQCCRFGRMIHVRGTLSNINNRRVVATLPAGFRPVGRSYEFVQTMSGTAGRIGRWRVRTNGQIELMGSNGELRRTDNHYIYLSFPNG